MGCRKSKIRIELDKQEVHIDYLIRQNERLQNDLVVMQNETLKYLQDETNMLSVQ